MYNRPTSILLIEDDPILAMGLAVELQDHGFDVNNAYSGEGAIEALRMGMAPSDLILMDLDLGRGLDGAQTAKQILADFDIPIVFLSSHSEDEFTALTERIPSYGYLLKDNGTPIIVAAVRTALKEYKSKRRARENPVGEPSANIRPELRVPAPGRRPPSRGKTSF
ncbi:MAG TPA: response regulator [Rectinemataceae bacterium]|nr:response regulator [Rectinemataceae bacterium]